MSEMQNGTMMTHPLIQEVGTVVHPDDHSAVQVHSTMLNATNREIQEMKERMGKMEEKFDIIYELASSIKVLSTQMLNINDNVRDMKKEFSQDIKDIKHEQQSISEKVDKIEVESSGSSEKNSDKIGRAHV